MTKVILAGIDILKPRLAAHLLIELTAIIG
jgi:hypothetical protein